MKIYMFLFKFLSLLPMNNIELSFLHNHMFEKIVCVSEISTPLKDIQTLDDNKDGRLWIHFRSSNRFQAQLDNVVTVDLPKLYKTVVFNKRIEQQKPIDQFKYSLFSSHRFSNYLSYDEFCQLEYVIADIIQSYIDDQHTQPIGIVIDEISCNLIVLSTKEMEKSKHHYYSDKKILPNYPTLC